LTRWLWGHVMSRSFFNGGLLPQVQPAADPAEPRPLPAQNLEVVTLPPLEEAGTPQDTLPADADLQFPPFT
jgi:hypothetical protein